jgi:lactoylglutathione lyase
MLKFVYTGVEVKDMDTSIRFYTEGLGMTLLDRHPIPATGGEVAALRSLESEQLLELNAYPRSKYGPGSELDHLAFETDDVEREIRRLEGFGAKRARATEVRPKYVVGFVTDPNGIWIEVFSERK